MKVSKIDKKIRPVKSTMYAVFVAGALTGCTFDNDSSEKCQGASVSDDNGLIVEGSCDKKPIISLSGSDRIEVNSIDNYFEFGAVASDAEDGDLTVEITDDLSNKSGTYTVTYTATDSAGNTVSVDRIVVIDETFISNSDDIGSGDTSSGSAGSDDAGSDDAGSDDAGTDVTPPLDSDNDGVADDSDAFPNDASETTDSDNDGVGDNSDAFPNDATETTDTDNDGIGDNADYAPNDPNVTEAPTVPATPTGGLVLDFENVTDANAEYPPYNTVVSIDQKLEVDGVTSRNMLVIDNGPGPWWSGVNLVVEYSESNLIGDGSAPITMRVFADQDGNLNLELEADGQDAYIMNSLVTAGWNDLSFDVSGADASINWHKVQIRPDALGQVDNAVATKYYIDDIHFANATIVQPPADPSSEAFLAGAATPSVIDAVSLFSDVFTPSALNTVGITGWSNPNTAGSEITINNDNIIKKFEQTIFAGFDVPTDFSIAGKTTMSVSLYRQASSEFEIKLVDLTDGAGEVIYYIPTAEMPIDQWSTIDIDLSDFTGSVENIDQVVIKPMAGAETFYMDDMYFHGTVAPVETIISIPELATATQHVYVSGNETSEDGSQETVVVSYNADDTTTTGLGLRIHFDSSVLSASDIATLTTTDLFVNGTLIDDTDDFDGDASTDKYLNYSWASLFGNWPGSAPADLASITFDIAEGATGSSAINFSSASNAAGFAFAGQSHNLVLAAAEVIPAAELVIDNAAGTVSLDGEANSDVVADYSFTVDATDAQGNAIGSQTVPVVVVDQLVSADAASYTGTADADVFALTDGSAEITSGAGEDEFILVYSSLDEEAHTITDFESGADTINIGEVLVAAGYTAENAPAQLASADMSADILDLVNGNDSSLDNLFGATYDEDSNTLTVFADGDSSVGATDMDSIQITLDENASVEDDDIVANLSQFIA